MLDQLINYFLGLSDIAKIFATMLVSSFPIVELRGGVPFGLSLGLNIWVVLIFAIVGNLLPIPFVIIFSRKIVNFLKKTKVLGWFGRWIERKSEKNKDKVLKYEKWGLLLFVAIPLPMTGAWTGAIIASFLDLRLKNAILPIIIGVIIAGIIMTALSFAGISLFSEAIV